MPAPINPAAVWIQEMLVVPLSQFVFVRSHVPLPSWGRPCAASASHTSAFSADPVSSTSARFVPTSATCTLVSAYGEAKPDRSSAKAFVANPLIAPEIVANGRT